MTQITPTLTLHTRPEGSGIHINSLIMRHNGNAYHIHCATKDTIHVFTQSIAMYVLTINRANQTISLSGYMAPEPFPINNFSLHTRKEINDILGAKWEHLSPEVIAEKLINYLM